MVSTSRILASYLMIRLTNSLIILVSVYLPLSSCKQENPSSRRNTKGGSSDNGVGTNDGVKNWNSSSYPYTYSCTYESTPFAEYTGKTCADVYMDIPYLEKNDPFTLKSMKIVCKQVLTTRCAEKNARVKVIDNYKGIKQVVYLYKNDSPIQGSQAETP